MQLFMAEIYPLHSYCLGTENLLYLFENWCHITFERGETPIAYYSVQVESSQFDQHFWPFFSYFATIKFFCEDRFVAEARKELV